MHFVQGTQTFCMIVLTSIDEQNGQIQIFFIEKQVLLKQQKRKPLIWIQICIKQKRIRNPSIFF